MKWFGVVTLILALVAGGVWLWQDDIEWPFAPSTDERQKGPPPLPAADPGSIICTGIVEAVGGELHISAQIEGEIEELRVGEGDRVRRGDVLAVIDARRYEKALTVAAAELASAQARLEQVKAGAGKEEREASRLAVEVVAAELRYERSKLARQRKLLEQNSVSQDDVEQTESRVDQLETRLASSRQSHAALIRGPLPEEIAVAGRAVDLAQAELERAKHEYELRNVVAPSDGVVVELFRHAGDTVSPLYDSPILSLIDPARLRLRIEIDELDAPRIKLPIEGTFELRGLPDMQGQFVLKTLLPRYGPKRLFEPDRSARLDTRTLSGLAEIVQPPGPLYHGQRITATLPLDKGHSR